MPPASAPRARLDWRRPDHWVAFGLGSGLAPVAPGTAGAALGTLVYAWLLAELGPVLYGLLVLLAFGIGLVACGRVSRDIGVDDHGAIVWDEIVGVWIALAAAGTDWRWIAAGFVLFRVLDVAKPGPVGWADARVKGGLGIMLDDVVAGILTALALAAARFVTDV